MLRLACAAALPALALGHGAVVRPPPRQAVDKDLKPWDGVVVPKTFPNVESKTGLCPVPGPDGKPSLQNGQGQLTDRCLLSY